MNITTSVLLSSFFALGLLVSNAYATSVSITTEKETYYYGDYLTFTVKVDKVTEDISTLYIADSIGKKSSPIPFGITDVTNTQTFPFPFDKIVYPEGEWTFEVHYAGEVASTVFYLKDAGNIVIPVWIKDVGKLWVENHITGQQFATAIEYLIRQEIIVVPIVESDQDTDAEIPLWVKTNAKWWIDGLIDDDTFALGLQHLVKVGVITV